MGKIENAGLQLAIENIAVSVLRLLVLAIFELLEAAAAVLEAALAGLLTGELAGQAA